MNPTRFCSVFGACKSPTYTLENFTAWEASVLEGSSPYFTPTTGLDYFNFAQISDIHLDNLYEAGSSYQCSVLPCCRGAAGSTGNMAGK